MAIRENFLPPSVTLIPRTRKTNKLPRVYLPGLLTRRWAEYNVFKLGIYQNHQ